MDCVFETVYTIGNWTYAAAAFTPALFAALFAGAIVAAASLVDRRRRTGPRLRRPLTVVSLLFFCLSLLLSLKGMGDRNRYREFLQMGAVDITAGRATVRVLPAPGQCKAEEIRIGQARFRVRNGNPGDLAFHSPACAGGPPLEGRCLRVAHIGNAILSIDAAPAGCCASP